VTSQEGLSSVELVFEFSYKSDKPLELIKFHGVSVCTVSFKMNLSFDGLLTMLLWTLEVARSLNRLRFLEK
jgi:hypothetical protein